MLSVSLIQDVYFTLHAVRFAAVLAVTGKLFPPKQTSFLCIALDRFVKASRRSFVNDVYLSHFSPSAFHTCQPTAFTCANGRCAPYSYRCDHYNDCGDNSDEVGCLFRTCDPHTEFTCNNGRCISLDYVCNGVNNCYDNGTSDERNCRKLIPTMYHPLGSDSLGC